ncbi:MAG: hypothetical protein ACLU84_07190 [Clostridia bacterium]
MEEEKKQSKLYLKWWFWVCIVMIVVVLVFTSIMLVAIGKISSGITGISMQIQTIYREATLYDSVENKSLILELNHFKVNEYSTQFNNMITIIKNNLNTELSNYNKLIIFTMIDGDKKENYLTIRTVYSLPDFMEIEERKYIDYDNYTELFNTYERTMDNYTQLFNSIGR